MSSYQYEKCGSKTCPCNDDLPTVKLKLHEAMVPKLSVGAEFLVDGVEYVIEREGDMPGTWTAARKDQKEVDNALFELNNAVKFPARPFQYDDGMSNTVDWEAVAEEHDNNDEHVVYVSGPMRGYPEYNYPAFNEAAELLSNYGYEVVNPAKNFKGRTDLDQTTYLRVDVGVMAQKCNAIYFLPGWQNSAGARLEWHVAKALGFTIVNPQIEGDDTDVSQPVEYEASSIVRNGERQMNYGHPNQDFARTAGMWTAFLAHKLKPGAAITMEEMALMMGQLKMSRLASTPGHHDSIVDLIGYAVCYDRLGETE